MLADPSSSLIGVLGELSSHTSNAMQPTRCEMEDTNLLLRTEANYVHWPIFNAASIEVSRHYPVYSVFFLVC